MESIIEVDTFSPTVSVPQNGIDLRNAESVKTGFQALSNRTKNLDTRLTHDHNLLLLNLHLHYPVIYDPGAANWGLLNNYAVGQRVMRQTNVSDSFRFFWIPLTGLPAAGWRFSQISVYLKGNSVHSPGTVPDVSLWRYDSTMGSAATQVGTDGVDDPTAVGYDDWHPVNVADISGEALVIGSVYYLRVGGEAGVDAETLLECFGARVILQVPADYPY